MKEKLEVSNIDDRILVHKDVFNSDILEKLKNKDKKSLMYLSIGLAMLTNKHYNEKFNKYGSLISVLLTDTKIDNQEYKPGTLVIIGKNHRKNNTYNLENNLVFYEQYYLPNIYRTIDERIEYMKSMSDIFNNKDFTCPQKCLKLDILGSGCFGNVYKSKKEGKEFAVKITCLDKKALDNPYSCNVAAWHEVHFLSNILKPIIEKKICPNLPLIYNVYSCPECTITISNEKKKGPCASTMIELADGNLRNFLSQKRKKEELYSCLFQIFAGLYTIQKYAQLMNFDVKKENILFYNVEPGGYWKYVIYGQTYYVPNYGKLFVLNDFGISRSMSPKNIMYRSDKEKTFRLGSRFAFVKDNKFIPIEVDTSYNEKGEKTDTIEVTWDCDNKSRGCEFRINRKTKKFYPIELKIKDKPLDIKLNDELFSNSDLFPPFEFYNDTQDAIRMFVGGKRTTQKGNHRTIDNLPKDFVKKLKSYLGESESLKNYKFPTDPSKVMAGYFIKSFFGCYRKKPKNLEIIEEYIIS
jgi:hypothetical protein